MINLSITRGCVQEPAEQFVEGAETFVRVCDPVGASLLINSDERCILILKVDGYEALHQVIEAAQNYGFPLGEILRPKRSAAQLARAGFLSLFGAARPVQEELPNDFVLELRQPRTGAPLEASYHFRLLSDEAFDSRFAGYLGARVVDQPKPVYTCDARPIECLASVTKCAACGTVITDCIAGCENADCPTAKVQYTLEAAKTTGASTPAKPTR